MDRDKTDVTTSELEDELLASSQETIVDSSETARSASAPKQPPHPGSTAGTSSTSVPRPYKAQINPSGSSATDKNLKTASLHRRVDFKRATFFLSKIAKNKEAGTPHEKDAADKIRYEKIVEEYNNLFVHPEKTAKRNRSLEEGNPPQKKAKTGGTKKKGPPQGAAQSRTLSEIVRDDLQVAIVDELSTDNKGLMSVWNSIEAKLSEMVFLYTLSANEGPYPSFDSGEMLRGYRVIKCEDGFSRDFLSKSVDEISTKWDGLKLKLIPAKEIPKQPLARIWLPLMSIKPSGTELIRSLQRLNPLIPMHDWAVIKTEEPQKNSASYLLRICEVSRGALEKADFKLRFGIRNAKIKILQSQEADPNLVEDIVEDDDTPKEAGFSGERLVTDDAESDIN
ncbi:uncharacterized protein LOC129915028 [Episyrphus balteatus]|uniref:uncharacterized protein LOC129912801 n=1 Tax=Episyrphus balteatus TaxID=286459 RepID=UPI0024868143|nr:uncharacterized protein LOC129912801 [Episyrphus balteatus]XP_055850458.1 uncharacterized protein LOC129915028 [Episyrphus balteatus]